MGIKEVRSKVKKYRELKADIVDLEIRIKEKEFECIGITAAPRGERTSPTYKITSSVEQQAEKHTEEVQKLENEKFAKEMKLKRIDNALTVLDETHRYVIEETLIKGNHYYDVECKLSLSYQRVKQLEVEALNDMSKYV